MHEFGRIFRICIYGESHGQCISVGIDGCPPGISLTTSDLAVELAKRRSGKPGTTARSEEDTPVFLSGVYNDKTTGAPLLISVRNSDARSKDYEKFISHPRPGHADFVASKKYGTYNDPRGGGHFSGRLTLALVIAGAIAKKIAPNLNIEARLVEVHGNEDFEVEIKRAAEDHNSVGGIIACKATGVPTGLGEPFFDSMESVLSHLLFSVPGIKGVEFGAGFQVAKMYGSEMNDCFIDARGTTLTNNSGGINGGISSGNPLEFRVAVRPPASISKPQMTYNFATDKIEELKVEGRHDTCFALRAPVVIEACAAIVLVDFILQKAATDRI